MEISWSIRATVDFDTRKLSCHGKESSKTLISHISEPAPDTLVCVAQFGLCTPVYASHRLSVKSILNAMKFNLD
jgi:hypothetical protein